MGRRTLILLLAVVLLAVALAAAAWHPFSSPHRPSLSPPAPSAPPAPVRHRPGIPAEFEPNAAVILGLNELLQYHPKTLTAIIDGLRGGMPVLGIVDDEKQFDQILTLLEQARIHAPNLTLITVPLDGMWIRDYGPVFVRRPSGRIVVLDSQYNESDRHRDDYIPRYLAGYFRLPIANSPLIIEGGNLLSNGQGVYITSTTVIARNQPRGYETPAIGSVLRETYGASMWVYLKPLIGETTGHVDMFMTLVAPNVVVLGQYDPSIDAANAQRLDEHAALLSRTQTPQGPLQVVRIPMPPNTDGEFRTYTNVIFANGTLLVPQYPGVSPDLDKHALDLYARLLPGWKIVGIDSSTIIKKSGSLHCVSINVPQLLGLPRDGVGRTAPTDRVPAADDF